MSIEVSYSPIDTILPTISPPHLIDQLSIPGSKINIYAHEIAHSLVCLYLNFELFGISFVPNNTSIARAVRGVAGPRWVGIISIASVALIDIFPNYVPHGCDVDIDMVLKARKADEEKMEAFTISSDILSKYGSEIILKIIELMIEAEKSIFTGEEFVCLLDMAKKIVTENNRPRP